MVTVVVVMVLVPVLLLFLFLLFDAALLGASETPQQRLTQKPVAFKV